MKELITDRTVVTSVSGNLISWLTSQALPVISFATAVLTLIYTAYKLYYLIKNKGK